jgi:hypothetical protein
MLLPRCFLLLALGPLAVFSQAQSNSGAAISKARLQLSDSDRASIMKVRMAAGAIQQQIEVQADAPVAGAGLNGGNYTANGRPFSAGPSLGVSPRPMMPASSSWASRSTGDKPGLAPRNPGCNSSTRRADYAQTFSTGPAMLTFSAASAESQ